MAGIAGYTDAARSMKVKGVRAAKLAAVLFNPSSYMSLLIASPLSHLAFDFSKVYSNGEVRPSRFALDITRDRAQWRGCWVWLSRWLILRGTQALRGGAVPQQT